MTESSNTTILKSKKVQSEQNEECQICDLTTEKKQYVAKESVDPIKSVEDKTYISNKQADDDA